MKSDKVKLNFFIYLSLGYFKKVFYLFTEESQVARLALFFVVVFSEKILSYGLIFVILY